MDFEEPDRVNFFFSLLQAPEKAKEGRWRTDHLFPLHLVYLVLLLVLNNLGRGHVFQPQV